MDMNDGKYLPIAHKSAAALIDGSVICVGVSTITASRCVQNLGVVIDRHLDIKKTCHKLSAHAHSTSAHSTSAHSTSAHSTSAHSTSAISI